MFCVPEVWGWRGGVVRRERERQRKEEGKRGGKRGERGRIDIRVFYVREREGGVEGRELGGEDGEAKTERKRQNWGGDEDIRLFRANKI